MNDDQIAELKDKILKEAVTQSVSQAVSKAKISDSDFESKFLDLYKK